MVFHGHIKDGRIVLDEPVSLPEGAAVSVRVAEAGGDATGTGSTLGRSLLRFAGVVKGLPRDASRRHDHYLYGTPKDE